MPDHRRVRAAETRARGHVHGEHGTGGDPTPSPFPDGPVLEVRSLSKSFGAVRALINVDLSLYAGEVLSLLGDNGAGKTTLVKCISGILTPDTGEILIEGEPVRVANPEIARRFGIETVHQDLALVDHLNVTENIFLRRELPTRWPLLRRIGWMDKKRMHGETRRLFGDLGIQIPSTRVAAAYLSGGQRQIVAVTRAVMWGRRILLMDEPAAALGVEQSRMVIELVRRLRDQGMAVLFISHNMQQVVDVCDRAVVLRHGRKVGDVLISDVTPRDLVDLITGAREL